VSSASNSGSVGTQIGPNNPNDCYKQQIQQQQSDSRSVASQSNQERYGQSDQETQSSEHVGGRMVDRLEKSAEKSTVDFSKCAEARTSNCERFGHYQAQSGEHVGIRMGGERHEKAVDKPSIDYSKCGEGRQPSCERFGHYQAQSCEQAHQVGARMGERHDKSSDKTSVDFAKCVADGRQSGCERFGHYQTSAFGQSPLQGHYGGGHAGTDRFARFNDLSALHGEQRASSSDRYSVCNPELRFDAVGPNGPSEYANANALAGPFASETFPSPPSPAPANDRFVPPPPLSPSPSEKYASSQSLAGYPATDRIFPPNSPGSKYNGDGTAPGSPMPAKERFASAERLLVNQQSAAGDTKTDQQRYVAPPDRLLSGSSPVLGGLQTGLQTGLQASGVYVKDARYATISADRILSSSPIHAPVPERFVGKSERYLGESPIHDRYPRQDPSTTAHHDRYSTMAAATERSFTQYICFDRTFHLSLNFHPNCQIPLSSDRYRYSIPLICGRVDVSFEQRYVIRDNYYLLVATLSKRVNANANEFI